MSSAATDIFLVAQSYIIYGFSILIICGTIGNILNLYTFLSVKQLRKCPTKYYVVAESICSLALLLIGLLPRLFIETFQIKYLGNQWLVCKLRIPINQWSSLTALSIVTFMALDQYLSTSHNPRWRQMSNVKLAKRLIGSASIFWFIYNIPFVVFYDVQVAFGCLIINTALKQYYSYFHLMVLFGFLPLIFTVTISVLAYRNVRLIHRLHMTNTRRKLDHQMTAMVFARVTFMIVCLIPFLAQRFYTINVQTDRNNLLRASIEYLVAAINTSITYLNIAVRIFAILSLRLIDDHEFSRVNSISTSLYLLVIVDKSNLH